MNDHVSLKELIQQRIQNRTALSGLSVVAKADIPTLRLYDIIGEPFITADAVAAALDTVSGENLEVHINSPGGDVFESVAIFNLLRSHPGNVTTRVDSLAASGASIIAQAGSRRLMLESSEMMIHQAHGMVIGGTSDLMRETADLLDAQNDKLAEIYARASGNPDNTDHFLEMMSSGVMNMGTWLTPDQAVAEGLADEVVVPDKKAKAQLAPPKFSDQLAEAVASLEKVAAEAENVVTFRSEQGKPPLSDEAVALVDRAAAALSGLQAEPETEGTPVSSLTPLPPKDSVVASNYS